MVKRIDAYEKVTGKALYADDIFLTKMLYAKPLYAEHPHAKILNIDLSEAKQIEGVIDIITSNDCPGSKQVGGVKKDHYVLAHEKTRYIGDVVAMVAAESYDIACSAVSAIKVNYEVLPNISDPEEALKPGSPKVHEDKENNLTEHFKLRHGDMEIGWKNSTKTFEAEFKTQWVEHAYMEPESCVAIKNPDGSVTVYGGMQHPFSTRRYTSEFLGLPLNKVQIIQTTLGGGFGGKDDTASVVCARAALLALRTERPVKLTLTREESMLESYKRHPFKVKLKIGVDNDNKIQALDSYIVADGGPYCAVSPFVIWRPTVQCTGPYIVPNVTCDSYAVYTTNPLCGAMRGFGTPQYNFAVESFIDHVAHQLNIDPIKFRRNNFFKQDCEIATGQKLTNHTVSIIQVVEETLKKFNWDEKYQKCSKGQASDNKYYGIGLSCSYRGVSLGAEGKDFCSAIVNIQQDGSVLLEVGVAENGQGSKTAMTSILCAELGIKQESVRFLDMDTSSITDGGPTVASRGTLVGGNAVLDACKQIKNILKPIVEDLVGKTKSGYRFYDGRVINLKSKKEVPWENIIAECYDRKTYPYALGTWRGPNTHWDEEKGCGEAYFTYMYNCNACEVEVDATTGQVKVISAIGAHDIGRAINTQMLEGQINGGLLMAMGQGLTEELIVNDGRIESLNFNKYKIAKIKDMPKLESIIIENPDPAGPWGAKAIGEPVNELLAGAIANAVFNATGVRMFELPITKERMLKELKKDGI